MSPTKMTPLQAMLKDPMLTDPGKLTAARLLALARAGRREIWRFLGGGGEDAASMLLMDPLVLCGVTRDVESPAYYRLKKEETQADQQRQQLRLAREGGGLGHCTLASLTPDLSTRHFAAALPMAKGDFWRDEETTRESIDDAKEWCEEYVDKVSRICAIAVADKHSYPEGTDLEDLEERAKSGPACALIKQVYCATWEQAIKTVGIWYGKDKKKPAKVKSIFCWIFKDLNKFRGKHCRFEGLFLMMARLLSFTEQKFTGPGELAAVINTTMTEVEDKVDEKIKAAEQRTEAAIARALARAGGGRGNQRQRAQQPDEWFEDDAGSWHAPGGAGRGAGRGKGGRGKGGKGQQGKGGKGAQPAAELCTRCHRGGHTADKCWSWKDPDGNFLGQPPCNPPEGWRPRKGEGQGDDEESKSGATAVSGLTSASGSTKKD
jgi:hypothetical protein